jgi:arylamine N-acetyltransferase
LCYTLNVFSKVLLEVLGFDIHWIGSNIRFPNNHILTVVNNLKSPGDKYLVDVGLGLPNFEPIPIDFEDESPVYAESHSVDKYVCKDGTLTRYQKRKRYALVAKGDAEWRSIFITDDRLQPRQYSYFDESMEKVYTDSDAVASPFPKTLRIIIYHREGANMKCVALKDSSLLLENESHDLEEVKLKSVEEILEKVDLYFPLLSDAARKAVRNVKFVF